MHAPRTAAIAAALAGSLVLAQPLAATPPQEATGTSTRLAVVAASTSTAGGNTFIEQVNVGVMTGTIAGTFVAEARLVIHPSGVVTAAVTRTCSCTVEGRSGTIVFRYAVVGEASAPPIFDIRGTIVSADGDLEGLHATLHEVQIGTSGGYTGTYHFEP